MQIFSHPFPRLHSIRVTSLDSPSYLVPTLIHPISCQRNLTTVRLEGSRAYEADDLSVLDPWDLSPLLSTLRHIQSLNALSLTFPKGVCVLSSPVEPLPHITSLTIGSAVFHVGAVDPFMHCFPGVRSLPQGRMRLDPSLTVWVWGGR